MASSILDIEPSINLFEAQSKVMHQLYGYVRTMSLKCAMELSIPDIIHKHGRPMSLDHLVSCLNLTNRVKSNGVYRLMRILTHSGFFVMEKISSVKEEEGYSLTPPSLILVESHPLSLKPYVMINFHSTFMEPWQHMAKWFQNDDLTPCHTAYETSFWKKVESDPEFSRDFDAGMASDTRLSSSMIIKDCKHMFEGLNSIVDVGGGTGTFAKLIVDQFPHIHCTILDLPHVIEGLEGTQNLKYMAGDMFNHIPPADAILMKWILHIWDEKEAIEILKRCKEAIAGNEGKGSGKVIIIQMTVEHEQITKPNDHENQFFMDMLMMTLSAGKERTRKEWEKLFVDAGFSSHRITHFSDLKSVIEVFP